MTRRWSVVLLLVGLVLTSGCLGSVTLGPGPEANTEPAGNATQFTRPNATDPVRLALPEPPANLSAATVGAYVAGREEVRMHNAILADRDETITELGTSCDAVAVEPDGDAFRVTVECGHWYEFEAGAGRGIADGAPYRTTYEVGPDGVEWSGEMEYTY